MRVIENKTWEVDKGSDIMPWYHGSDSQISNFIL